MRLTNEPGRARHETAQRWSLSMQMTITQGLQRTGALRARANARTKCGVRGGRSSRFPSGVDAPLDAGLVQDATADLLDRAVGGVDERDAEPLEQPFGGAHLVVDLMRRSVPALRPAFVAYLLQ